MKNIFFLFILVLVMAGSFFLFKKEKDASTPADLAALQTLSEQDLAPKTEEEKKEAAKDLSNEEQTEEAKKSNTPAAHKSQATQNIPKFDSKAPLSRQEQDSIRALATTMAEASADSHKPETLIKNLEEAGLGPVIGKDFNEDTGKLVIVRTKNTIPGVRYIHGQYFEDENKKQFLQHFSFEVRPAPDAMEKAFEILKTFKKNLSKPKLSANFIEWTDEDGYSIWMKKLSLADIKELRSDPHNAYSPQDVGTVQVAIEQNPH